MKERWDLRKVEFGGKTFFQAKIGCKYDYIMWVSPKLVTQTQDGYFLELPIENVRLVWGRKNLILCPGGGRNLFNVFVRYARYSMSGWDESSVIIDTSPCEIFAYQPNANQQAALVLTESSEVEYRWRVVRAQTTKEGFGIVNLDGTVIEVEGEKEDALASLK